MENKRAILMIVTATLVLAAWVVVRAADKAEQRTIPLTFAAMQRSTLRGLQGVYVVVENPGPEAEQFGLTQADLQSDTELQLRQRGIKVLTNQESVRTPGFPYLYVATGFVLSGSESAAIAVKVALMQRVVLERDPMLSCSAATWSVGYAATADAKQARQVRDSIRAGVSGFVNDYLAANPRQPSSEKPETSKGQ